MITRRMVCVLCLGLTPFACGRTALESGEDAQDARDAGVDVLTEAPGPDTRAPGCPSGTRSCGGACVAESAESCGPTCTACPPPPPFGHAVCTSSGCDIVCDEDSHRCGDMCCARLLALGDDFSCYLDAAGKVQCWGDNQYGQLGDGTLIGRGTPAPVLGLPDAVTLSAGRRSVCAVTTGGAIYCWGAPYDGLGHEEATSTTPRQKDEIPSGATAVALGTYLTCAIVEGDVLCWGYVDDSVFSLEPRKIAGFAKGEARALTAGSWHVCALTNAGGVKCFGTRAQIGSDDAIDRRFVKTVTDVEGLSSGVISVASRQFHTCAVRQDGTVACWGEGACGALGASGVSTSQTPVVATLVTDAMRRVATGDAVTYGQTPDGLVEYWGNGFVPPLDDCGPEPHVLTVSGLPSKVTSIGVGRLHACAVLEGSGVACWGNNAWRQLGDGTRVSSATPVLVKGL